MRIFSSYLPPIIALMLLSCTRKELPEPITSTPDFSVNGTLDGDNFQLVAGQNGYYADAHFEQDANGIYHFTGEIKKYNCPGCPGRLTIKLTSNEAYETGQHPPQGQAIVAQHYTFQVMPVVNDFLTFQFTAPPGQNSTYYWSFGDGGHSTEQNPQHTYQNPGPKEVTLSMFGLGWCSGNSSQTIYVGSNQMCSIPFEIQDGEGNHLNLSLPEEMPEGLELVSWSVDNNPAFPPDNEFEVEFNWGITHNICAQFYNSDLECYGSYCALLFGTGQQPCTVLMNSQATGQSIAPGSVVIEYESDSGELFTSIYPGNNSPENYFEVTEIADYGSMINGHATQRAHVKFTATLVNTDDNESTITFENVSADILFSIP